VDAKIDAAPPTAPGLGSSNFTPKALKNGFRGESGRFNNPDNPVASKVAEIAKKREFMTEIPKGAFFIFL
jgi:hypothetical protein